ncbi:MAG: signal peptide peptidase SppA [Spirochaetales bacterium]|nr:signal peptide peptidase SppA [Spirochaetales bacterium]
MKYYKIVLSGAYRETGIQTKGLMSAADKEGFRFDQFYIKTEMLLKQKDVDKIFIECRTDFTVSLFAGLEEICERIEKLKENGKEVYFYAASYGVKELYIASFCSFRIIHPLGSLKFPGISQSFSFTSRFLRRFGVEAEVVRRAEYKSAGDRFSTDRLQDANKEQYEFYLNSVMAELKAKIISGFGKTSDDLQLLLDGKVYPASVAEDESWIDEVATSSEFLERWKDGGDKEFKIKKLPDKIGGKFSFKSSQIAVLVFEGSIIDGHSKRHPLLGQSVGAESFIPVIRKIRENKKIKAVVLRINSGGGSAIASEDITSELRLLADKKPLIVSMSEVAGSGGYWMSCCGEKTFALPTTLTGSIGVISIYLNWHRLSDSLGLTHDTIRIGEHSDLGSPYRSITEKERQIIDGEIENMYGSFIQTVSSARKLENTAVRKIAGGRVWPGLAASENGLVDSVGGLSAAIKAAMNAAGKENASIKFYPEIKQGLAEKLLSNLSKNDEDDLELLTNIAKLKLKDFSCKEPLAVVEETLFSGRG